MPFGRHVGAIFDNSSYVLPGMGYAAEMIVDPQLLAFRLPMRARRGDRYGKQDVGQAAVITESEQLARRQSKEVRNMFQKTSRYVHLAWRAFGCRSGISGRDRKTLFAAILRRERPRSGSRGRTE